MHTDSPTVVLTLKSDLVKIVKHYLPLKESRRALKADCPFHADQSASLMVLPDKNIFKCLGCGQEGGAIEFIMLIEKKSRSEAECYLENKHFS